MTDFDSVILEIAQTQSWLLFQYPSPTLNWILFLSPRLQNRICGTSGCDADSLQAQIKLWSLQSNVTYVASPAQSWIDDYFAWLNSGQCCKYDENTLEVRSERELKFRTGSTELWQCSNKFKQNLRLKLCRGLRLYLGVCTWAHASKSLYVLAVPGTRVTKHVRK